MEAVRYIRNVLNLRVLKSYETGYSSLCICVLLIYKTENVCGLIDNKCFRSYKTRFQTQQRNYSKKQKNVFMITNITLY